MDFGRAMATLPFATKRFAGFLRAGLRVLSVLRVGIFVTCIVEVCRPNGLWVTGPKHAGRLPQIYRKR
jgi:hypothetical protein